MKKYLGLNSETNFDFELRKDFTGVGMIRGENLCISQMQYFTKSELCEYVYKYLQLVAKEFKDCDVWYRTADLTPHQINLLDGCDIKLEEQQYLIGLRGIRRNLACIETYQKELATFIEAYRQNGNLGLLIPFVSTIDEVLATRKILSSFKYDGKLGVMIEISSMIFMLDELNKLGIDNYTIGINDLTTSILCAYRDLDAYSITNEAVLRAISMIADKVHSFDKTVTLAGYLNKEIVDFANQQGIDIVNVHYNDIPKIYEVPNPEFYTSHYDDIKKRYKARKYEKIY